MALATLSIDVEARLAGLEAGMDRAARIAKQNADKIDRSFSGLKSLGAGLGASLAAAFSVTAIRTFITTTIDGVDALNDLKDATGASIENISALEDIGARTGTTFESVGQTLVKFNQVLNDAKGGTEQERVLKAIGLSAQELKKIDPAEALRQTAIALSKYADDGNKARIVQELFGKNVREIAPFLKDLAEAGGLNATVTTQQAEEAEKFNKQLSALQKNVTDLARAMSGPLVSSINEFADRLKFAQARGDGFFSAALDQYRANVRKFYEDIGLLSKENPLLSPNKVFSLPDFTAGGSKPSAPDLPDKPKSGRNPSLSREQIANLQLAAEEEAAKEAAEAWDIYTKFQIKSAEERGDAEKAMWKQIFEEIDAEQERAIEEGKAFLDAQTKQVDEFAMEAARNIQDALGNTISSTLKGDFDNIGDLWRDLLIDMASQALSAQLGKYLFGDFGKTGDASGGALGDLFKFFVGSFASGTDFVPRDGLAMVHKGERIVTADKNRASASFGGGSVFDFSGAVYNVGDGVSIGQVAAAVEFGNRQLEAKVMRVLRKSAVA